MRWTGPVNPVYIKAADLAEGDVVFTGDRFGVVVDGTVVDDHGMRRHKAEYVRIGRIDGRLNGEVLSNITVGVRRFIAKRNADTRQREQIAQTLARARTVRQLLIGP